MKSCANFNEVSESQTRGDAMNDNPELDKFNTVLRKVLSVPRDELKRREAEWKREKARKKKKATKKATKQSERL